MVVVAGSFSEEWTALFSNSGVSKVLSSSKGWEGASKALLLSLSSVSWQENVGVTSKSWVDVMVEFDSESWEEMTERGEVGTGVQKKYGTRASPGLENDVETVYGEEGNDAREQGEQQE